MTNPRPCLLASVHTLVGFATSKKANTGAVIKHSFAFSSAWSCSIVHVNSFFVLRRGLNGAINSAVALVPDVNWLANPINERSSVRVVGVGNCFIAAVMEESTWYPSGVKWNPANLT